MADTSRIHALVGRARRRLKLQSALDSAVLAVVPAAASAAASVFLLRAEVVSESAALAMLAGCAALVAIGAIVGYARRFPTDLVATRIDRASGLSDRLASACAFERQLAGKHGLDRETEAMMRAAIADAIRVAPRADVKKATPFRRPEDIKPAVMFTVVGGLVSLLALPTEPVHPIITTIAPPAAPRGVEVELTGVRFGDGGTVMMGADPNALVMPVSNWSDTTIVARVPSEAKIGKTSIRVKHGSYVSEPLAFNVLPDGARYRDPNEPLAMSEEDLDYTRDLLEDLRMSAEANQDLELLALADDIKELLDQAERGELSREELLDRLAKAQEAYEKQAGNEQLAAEAMTDLKKTGQELQKSQVTREMGKALEKGDLEKAQEEMKKLAEKLKNGQLSEKEQAQAAKALEKAAEAFEKRQAKREKDANSQLDKAQKAVKDAEKELSDAKNEEQKQQAEKRLTLAKQKLDQAKKQQQQQQEAEQKRTLKRLHRNMKQASEQMQDQNPENRRQASRTMEDMVRDTGQVDQDRRKVTNKKKVASQLEDLKEAMRRAKQGKSRGPQDRFGRNKRNADFARRARGGKSSRQAWKPGQGPGQGGKGGKGQGQGKGQNGKGGQGKQPGGSEYGDGHDPDLLGDATGKTGDTKDESVSGIHGKKGPSTRETILSAAQKGFASREYKDVYVRYKQIVEDVVSNEKVPSGYKYYVKRYFQKIKPND